ncbi:hypothetical protein NC652_010595 [Populus alba x Populus x berolinensis]|nr:hypothetical protein NC652_010595 [Populus alba x Populus x berolinensis]
MSEFPPNCGQDIVRAFCSLGSMPGSGCLVPRHSGFSCSKQTCDSNCNNIIAACNLSIEQGNSSLNMEIHLHDNKLKYRACMGRIIENVESRLLLQSSHERRGEWWLALRSVLLRTVGK